MSIESLNRNKQQLVGFLNTPPLLLGFEYKEFELPEVEEFNPGPISDSLMLGKRVEQYFSDVIRHSNRFEILQENVQVYEEKKTIGEFDFLLKDENDQKYHVELVYKFYLYKEGEGNEEDCWVGPNLKDRLSLKLDKLRNHQFPLLKNVQAQSIVGEAKGYKQQVCFKAQLFVPFGGLARQFDLANSACITGVYFKLRDFIKFFSSGEPLFIIPDKIDWLMTVQRDVSWESFSSIISKITLLLDQKKSPMVWIKNHDGRLVKCFVVWW